MNSCSQSVTAPTDSIAGASSGRATAPTSFRPHRRRRRRDWAVQQTGRRGRADAMADLLEQHGVVDRPGDAAQSRDRTGEIGVAFVLHGLLQWIGVYRESVGADPISTGASSRLPRNSVPSSTASKRVWVSAL